MCGSKGLLFSSENIWISGFGIWTASFFVDDVYRIYSLKNASIPKSSMLGVFNPIFFKWAPSSEYVSSSIPSWQILTAHAQSFRGARSLAFCLKVPLDSLLVWASSEGSGETRSLAWTFAARISDKYQIRLTRSKYPTSPSMQDDNFER